MSASGWCTSGSSGDAGSAGRAHRAVVGLPSLLTQHGIGVVAPFDFALDRELWRWAPDDVSLYLTRLPFVPMPVTVEMAVGAVATARPCAGRRVTCWPRSRWRGRLRLRVGQLRARRGGRAAAEPEHPGRGRAARPTTTSGALVESLALLDARRIAVVTPYIDSVTDRLRRLPRRARVRGGLQRRARPAGPHLEGRLRRGGRGGQRGGPPDAEAVLHQLHERPDVRHHRPARAACSASPCSPRTR